MQRRARRWLLALVAPPTLLAFVLVAAEALLALGPDRRRCFVVPVGEGDATRFVTSGRPPTPSSKLRTREVPAEPAAGAVRVLMLGDSSMYGVPFEPPVPFAHQCAMRLPRLLPGRPFDVVNLGASGMCSDDVRDLLEECDGAGASLVVVYVGHNEFLDVNLPRVLTPARAAIRRALGRTRVGAALLDATRTRARSTVAGIFDPDALVDDEPLLSREAIERGLDRYRRNLEEIVAFARARGAEVALFLPVSNAFDPPPHRSTFSPSTSRVAREAFRIELCALSEAQQALEARAELDEPIDPSEIEALLARVGALERIDATVARLAWLRGRLLFLRGDVAAARDALRIALSNDDYPWRQLPRARAIAAESAARAGAIVVDAGPRFEAEAAPRLPDLTNLFVDDVHPSRRGHELLAEALLRTLAERGWMAPVEEWRFDEEPPIEEDRARADAQPDQQARDLAESAFLLIGESHFDPASKRALLAAQRRIEQAFALDAGCAEAHLGHAVLAAIRGDGDAALAAIARARDRDPSIDAFLVEPWETIPEMRSALRAAGLTVIDGRLASRR
jgi:lysophospholipase L1-like esterase